MNDARKNEIIREFNAVMRLVDCTMCLHTTTYIPLARNAVRAFAGRTALSGLSNICFQVQQYEEGQLSMDGGSPVGMFTLYCQSVARQGQSTLREYRIVKSTKCSHIFRRYGRDGWIILIDFKQFFPSVSHEMVLQRHTRFLLNDAVRKVGDDIVNTVPGGKGLPLGVEPSQAR